MPKLSTVIALAIVLPSIAYAQATPVAPAKEACCAKMKAEGKECCCDETAKRPDAEHAMKAIDHARE